MSSSPSSLQDGLQRLPGSRAQPRLRDERGGWRDPVARGHRVVRLEKQGQMPITRGKNAPVTLTLSEPVNH